MTVVTAPEKNICLLTLSKTPSIHSTHSHTAQFPQSFSLSVTENANSKTDLSKIEIPIKYKN